MSVFALSVSVKVETDPKLILNLRAKELNIGDLHVDYDFQGL